MDPESITLLTARAMRYLRSLGKGAVGWEDVAGALAGCCRGASLLARVKYADEDRWQDLSDALLIEVAGDERIRDFEPGTLRPLAGLACLEVCGGDTCKACHGVGCMEIEQKLILCSRCNGSGRHRLSERRKAGFLGVSRYKWKRQEKHYLVMVDQLHQWDQEVWRKLGVARFDHVKYFEN